MKFSINRDLLLNHLSHVQKGLPSEKTPLPILYSIKTEVTTDSIILTTNNGDVAIRTTILAGNYKIDEPGMVAINPQLIEVVRKTDAEVIDFTLTDKKILSYKASNFEWNPPLLDVEDYPEVDFLQSVEPFTIPASHLKTLVKETVFAAAITEKRPILTGINFSYVDGVLHVVSTDSYRLARKNLKINLGVADFSIVIPKSSLEIILRTLDVYSDDVLVYINPNKVLFKFGELLIQTRLLDGTYPDTSKIIPTEFVTQVTFKKEELLSAVGRVSLLSPRDKEANYNVIKFLLRTDKVVEISSTNVDVGNGKELIMPCDDVVGTGISIAFSSKYLVESLKALTSNEITLSFSGEVRPFTITNPHDKSLIQLILPVRID